METIRLIDYTPEFEEDFRQLNLEWISKYFVVEEPDRKAFENPKQNIIDAGGCIIFAFLGNEIVGTCALQKKSDGVYELAKMAVTPKAQGKQIGYLLGEAILENAKEMGAKKVFLLSNRGLLPALNLYKKLGFEEKPLQPEDSIYKRGNIRMEIEL